LIPDYHLCIVEASQIVETVAEGIRALDNPTEPITTISGPSATADIEMTRISEDTWRGYFYRDYLQDNDYYGLGVCNWDPGSVSAIFIVHGEEFSSGSVFDDFMRKGPQTEFFKKSEFLDSSLSGDGAWLTTPDDPEVLRKSEDFFPITVTVKEVKQ